MILSTRCGSPFHRISRLQALLRKCGTNMDTISASEDAVANDPKKQNMKPYIRVTGPPLSIAVELELRINQQRFR